MNITEEFSPGDAYTLFAYAARIPLSKSDANNSCPVDTSSLPPSCRIEHSSELVFGPLDQTHCWTKSSMGVHNCVTFPGLRSCTVQPKAPAQNSYRTVCGRSEEANPLFLFFNGAHYYSMRLDPVIEVASTQARSCQRHVAATSGHDSCLLRLYSVYTWGTGEFVHPTTICSPSCALLRPCDMRFLWYLSRWRFPGREKVALCQRKNPKASWTAAIHAGKTENAQRGGYSVFRRLGLCFPASCVTRVLSGSASSTEHEHARNNTAAVLQLKLTMRGTREPLWPRQTSIPMVMRPSEILPPPKIPNQACKQRLV